MGLDMNRSVIWVGVGVLLGLVGLVVVVLAQPYTLHGSVIEPPQPAPAIVLASSSGQNFELTQQRGRVVLVYFGYTYCPDVCPATLSQLRQVMAGLGEQAARVQVVLVTVDPQRDTPEILQRYMSAFGPTFTGLSGSEAQLDPVWKAYGVYRAIRPMGENPGAYTVDHTSRVYVIDLKGNLRLTYAMGTNVDDMVQDLKYLLKEG